METDGLGLNDGFALVAQDSQLQLPVSRRVDLLTSVKVRNK